MHSLLVINSKCISSKLVKYHRIFFFSFHLSPEILCVPLYQKQVLLYIQSLFPEFNVSWRVQDVKLRGLLVMLSNIIAWRLFYKYSINIISKNQSYNLFCNMQQKMYDEVFTEAYKAKFTQVNCIIRIIGMPLHGILYPNVITTIWQFSTICSICLVILFIFPLRPL